MAELQNLTDKEVIFRQTVTVVIGTNGIIPAEEKAKLMTNLSTGNSSGKNYVDTYSISRRFFYPKFFEQSVL